MNRSEIIHRSSQIFLEAMDQEEMQSYIYQSAKFSFENMSNDELIVTVNEFFPSVVEFIREEDPDE